VTDRQTDRQTDRHVAVAKTTLAERHLDNKNPVDHHLTLMLTITVSLTLMLILAITQHY